jgi:hypothetical protein
LKPFDLFAPPKYLFIHFIEHEAPELHGPREQTIQLPNSPLPDQLAALFHQIDPLHNKELRVDVAGLLMNSYLMPQVDDAKRFRDQISQSSIKSTDIGAGFTSTDRERSLWSYRDTSHCDGWLIELLCDDVTVMKAGNNQNNDIAHP